MRKALGMGGGLLVVAVTLVFLVPSVRHKLSGRLAGEPMVEGQPVRHWLYVLGEGDAKKERADAAIALGRLGREAPPEVATALARALADPEPEVRKNAALALGQVGADAGPLLAALADADGEVRAAAASSLGELRPTDPTVIPAMLKAAAGDPDVLTRLAAITALGRYGEKAAAAVPVLVDVLKENDTNLGSPHEFSVLALKKIGPQSLPAVTRALDRAEPRTRIGALKALAQFGSVARPSIPEVERRLADEDPLVRLEAVQCLWAIERNPGRTTRAALEHLRAPEANSQKRLQARAKALYILGEIGPEAKPAVPDLLTILKDDPESMIRMYSAQALGKMGPDPVIREALTAAAKNDKDPDVCRAANEALKAAGRL